MQKQWETVIEAQSKWYDFRLQEVWKYRDLCTTFIRKNYITKYKQTVLGPVYMILSPLLTSGLFTLIFGVIAGLSTDGIPDFLFYMIGNLSWSFFAGLFFENNNTFAGNAYIMGKVYFPRLVIPIANTLTRLINLGIQFFIFLGFYAFYLIKGDVPGIRFKCILVPFLLLELGLLGLGMGLIMSSLTIRYRDLNVMVGFGMNLLMYASPVLYPISNFPQQWRYIALLNPVAPVIEAVRYLLFGTGMCSIPYLLYSFLFTAMIVFVGLVLFNKVEKTFIDTI